MRFIRWCEAWITTWLVAPPFSKRRAELLEVLRDNNPENWVEVERPDPDAFGELGRTYLTDDQRKDDS